MLDARVVHLDSAAQMFDSGHDVEIPVNIPPRARRLCIPTIVDKKPAALFECDIVVANNLRERPPAPA